MGRNKEYRQRLSYQVKSVQKKTLENQFRLELRQNIGFSQAEAQLLSCRLAQWLQSQENFRSPNQILIQGALERTAFSRGRATRLGKTIKVTPFQASDLELELEFGLKVMQLGRILRIIDEAHAQNSLIDAKQLCLLCNITPTSLRSRLRKRWSLVFGCHCAEWLAKIGNEAGFFAPLTYLKHTFLEEVLPKHKS